MTKNPSLPKCEDPSLSLRMTWKETLIRYQIRSLVILILTVTGFFDSLTAAAVFLLLRQPLIFSYACIAAMTSSMVL